MFRISLSSAGRFLIVFLIAGLITGCGAPQTTELPVTAPPAGPINTNPTDMSIIPVAGPTATPAVSHVLIPGELPEETIAQAWDQDSSKTAAQKRAAGGDKFTQGLFERPFNSQAMDIYYPNLDIMGFSLQKDDTWLFVTILLQEAAAQDGLSGRYGFELDVDVDGQGDYLVLGFAPSSTEWTTGGVQVWQDANRNTGNDQPVQSNPPQVGDGYELNLFDQGQGNDPDASWMRISPEDSSQVQFALKLSLFNNDPAYTCWAWSGADLLDPSLFDLNDSFTQEEAGSPISSYFYYPLNSLSQIDNTCRVFSGGQLEGSSLGLCSVAASSEEGGCQVQGCPDGYFFSFQSCSCQPSVIN